MGESDETETQNPQDLTKHHDTFYFTNDPMAIFLVENRLFKVHRHYLIQESEIFRDMFSVPSEGGKEVEGMSDERPISLPGVTVKEFELLLKHFYTIPQPRSGALGYSVAGSSPGSGEQEENLAILSIAHRFAFDNVFKLMVQRLIPVQIPLTQRIRLGDKYNLEEWLFSAYGELLDRRASLTMDEVDALGSDRLVRYMRARDFMHQERLTITQEGIARRDAHIRLVEQNRHYCYAWSVPVSRIPKSGAHAAREYFAVSKTESG